MNKMTASQGYNCEFIDSVPDEFYCKKCTLVARRLVYTSCCEEIFCYDCIKNNQHQDELCPKCGEDFTIMELKRSQNKVMQLLVYCSMKDRGCVWSGTLEQLDTHLDPHLDNCQYVDTQCPLNCLQTIIKNKMEQHVAQECTKRPHVCQHCGFKATYKEVVDTHLPECKYVPLQCPNMCGVSCEREVMEDHMKICRLEEVECEFSSVGCDGRFIREDQDEHDRQNSHKHLTLTASLTVQTQQQLQKKLQEQDKKHKEEEEKLEMKTGEQEKKIEEQEKKLEEQEKKLEEQEKKLEEQAKEQQEKLGKLEKNLEDQEMKLREQEKKLGEQEKHLKEQEKTITELRAQATTMEKYNLKLSKLELALQESKKEIFHCTTFLNIKRKFTMQNFSKEKSKDKYNDWKSPAMYTHLFGYKFCIGVDANGYLGGRGKAMYMDVWHLPGEFDDKLKWPAEAQITIELINQRGGENAKLTKTFTLNKLPYLTDLKRVPDGFIEHSELSPFLVNDTLFFHVSDIRVVI